MHEASPIQFPYGQIGTSITTLAEWMMEPDENMSFRQLRCTECNHEESPTEGSLKYYMTCESNTLSNSSWLKHNKHGKNTQHKCPDCGYNMKRYEEYHKWPKLLVFDLHGPASKKISLVRQEKKKTYKLRGLVYLGGFHFNARVINEHGNIWYHDGISTGNLCEPEGELKNMSEKELMTCKYKNIALALYAK